MTTLRIDNMHCGACVRRVTLALNRLPGTKVEEVAIGAARLETTATAPEILAALQKAGYSAHIE